MKVFTKKEWRKYKKKRQADLDFIEEAAWNRGFEQGKSSGQQSRDDLLAAIVYNMVCRDPGQVTGKIEIETSLVGQVGVNVDHRGPTQRIHVFLKEYEPEVVTVRNAEALTS